MKSYLPRCVVTFATSSILLLCLVNCSSNDDLKKEIEQENTDRANRKQGTIDEQTKTGEFAVGDDLKYDDQSVIIGGAIVSDSYIRILFSTTERGLGCVKDENINTSDGTFYYTMAPSDEIDSTYIRLTMELDSEGKWVQESEFNYVGKSLSRVYHEPLELKGVTIESKSNNTVTGEINNLKFENGKILDGKFTIKVCE